MRKNNFKVIIVTVIALCLLLTTTYVPVSASSPKWTTGGNAEILGQSSETWVTESIRVDMKSGDGYVQLDQILSDLIGSNGLDGQGYINIIPDNYTNDYCFLQLVGNPAATGIDPVRDTKALTWYLRHDANPNSLVYLRGEGNPVEIYGRHVDISATGYMFAFTKNAAGNVCIRGISGKEWTSFDSYEDTVALISRLKLSEIVGTGSKTGEDGVYFRLQSFGDATSNLKYTINVVYPKPATSTLDVNKNSHWTVGGGAVITGETTETMVYDTVNVDLKNINGYIQHNVKLTELIGENEADGKGYVNVICDDYLNDYSFLQLVGNPTATGIDPVRDTKAFTWYLRTDGVSNSLVYLRGETNPVEIYGIQSQFANEGYKFAYSKNSAGNVLIRGIGDHVWETFDSYEDTKTDLTSRLKLSEIVGDAAGKTGEDGVYVRLQSFGDPGCNFVYTLTVAYPAPVETTPSTTPSATPNATPTPGASSATPGVPNKPTGDSSMMLIIMAFALCAGGAIVFYKKRALSK